MRPKADSSFRLVFLTTAVHPELEFMLYVPGTLDALSGLGVSEHDLIFLLMCIICLIIDRAALILNSFANCGKVLV